MGADPSDRSGRRYSRQVWAWAFYDFANSAYATALAGVVFSVFFVQVVVGPDGILLFGRQLHGSTLWGFAVSATMLLVACTAPVLGAIADHRASKKRFLFSLCYLGVAATSLLVLVGPGDVYLALALYVISSFCLEAGLTFYNGFLPEIAAREEMGRVSGFGWAFGYVGGVLCLVLNLAMIRQPAWLGLSPDDHIPVRVALLSIGVWWGVFAIPTFVWLKERRASPGAREAGYLKVGFRRLYGTIVNIGRYRELVKFMISFLLYNDGVQTVIVMAAVFGAEVLRMDQSELILCFILTHVVAFFGSLTFGALGDRLSTTRAIHFTLAVWTASVFYVLVINESWEFWVLAVVIGFVLGGTQAASRALLAQFTPPHKSAEFFGFFATGGRFASVLGPALFAIVTEKTGTPRLGVFSVLVFFLLGWGMLFFVDEKKGIAESARDLGEPLTTDRGPADRVRANSS